MILGKYSEGEQLANVNYKGLDENTSLHIAAEKGYAKICEFLLDYGENTHINSRNSLMETPLHLSCASGHLKISQLLVRSGGEIDSIDINGNTPLHRASQKSHSIIISWLLTRSPNIMIKNIDNKTAEETSPEDLKIHFHKYLKKTFTLSGPSFSSDIKTKFSQYKAILSKQPKTSKILSNFLGICELGRGSFGDVYLVLHKQTNKLHAMKILRKDKIFERNMMKYALTERNVLAYIRHPFIVPLNYAFQTSSKLFLVLEYCPGGDLSSHLLAEKCFSESRAKIYICEILLALEELHKNDVIYRDLKPENIVLDKNGHALLTDFGLSKEGVLDSFAAQSFCGSLAYLAPEIIQRNGHGKAVDWYLLGIVFYEMVVGVPPFFSSDKDELLNNISNGKLKIPAYLTNEAKDLIREVIFMQLTIRDPSKRLGAKGDAKEVKNHPFFRGIKWDSVMKKELKPPVPKQKPILKSKITSEALFGDQLSENLSTKVNFWSFVAD